MEKSESLSSLTATLARPDSTPILTSDRCSCLGFDRILDEDDRYINVADRVRVMRGPEKRVNAGKALQPLIQRFIERRKTHYGTNPAATPSTSATGANLFSAPSGEGGPVEPTIPASGINLNAKAFEKVKVRGGGVPARRSGFMNRQMSNSGASTPIAGLSRSPDRSTLSTVTSAPRGEGEREALLGRKDVDE